MACVYISNDLVFREAGARRVTFIVRERQLAFLGMWRDSLRRIPPTDSFFSKSEGLDHTEGPPARLMVGSRGVQSEGYGHVGSGVCLGDGQTEAHRVP